MSGSRATGNFCTAWRSPPGPPRDATGTSGVSVPTRRLDPRPPRLLRLSGPGSGDSRVNGIGEEPAVTPYCGAAMRWCALLGLLQSKTAGQVGFSPADREADPLGPVGSTPPTSPDPGPKAAYPRLFCLRVDDERTPRRASLWDPPPRARPGRNDAVFRKRVLSSGLPRRSQADFG